jgi:hypothetical protein
MHNYAWGWPIRAIRMNPAHWPRNYGIKSGAADMLRYVLINIVPAAWRQLCSALWRDYVGYFKVGSMVTGDWGGTFPGHVKNICWPATQESMLFGANPARKISRAASASYLPFQ